MIKIFNKIFHPLKILLFFLPYPLLFFYPPLYILAPYSGAFQLFIQRRLSWEQKGTWYAIEKLFCSPSLQHKLTFALTSLSFTVTWKFDVELSKNSSLGGASLIKLIKILHFPLLELFPERGRLNDKNAFRVCLPKKWRI